MPAGNPGGHLFHQDAITPLGAGQPQNLDRSAPAFRQNVVTAYGRNIHVWEPHNFQTLVIGGSPFDLRHFLPPIARGGTGEVRG